MLKCQEIGQLPLHLSSLTSNINVLRSSILVAGAQNNIRGIPQQILRNALTDRQQIDWKLAYFELVEVISHTKSKYPSGANL